MQDYTSVHRSRRDRRCAYGDTIAAGETYTREAVPPWVLIKDDPDLPPAPLGHWLVSTYHAACHQRAYWG